MYQALFLSCVGSRLHSPVHVLFGLIKPRVGFSYWFALVSSSIWFCRVSALAFSFSYVELSCRFSRVSSLAIRSFMCLPLLGFAMCVGSCLTFARVMLKLFAVCRLYLTFSCVSSSIWFCRASALQMYVSLYVCVLFILYYFKGRNICT